MEFYEEHTEGETIIRQEKLVITNEQGEQVPMNFQPAFNVLKSLGIDGYVSEEERKFLQVQ